MAGFIPVKCIPALVSMPVSTCSALEVGELLAQTAAGRVFSTSAAATLTSAANSRPAYVCAETKTPKSAFASGDTVLCWPILPQTVWEAVTSSAATCTMFDVRWNVQNRRVMNETTTDDGMFIIEAATNRHGTASASTNLKCLGRLVTNKYCYGSVP